MIEASVPESADGGYWYVLDTVADPEEGISPGVVPGAGWCAWYGVNNQVVIRTPAPVTGLQVISDIATSDILNQAGYSTRPFGRIGVA